jgi:RNA polymerase sigma-70 factor (ECF subfamily)
MTTFHELYTKYAPDVYRFSFSLCRNGDEAEDITSETFVRAWTSTAPIRHSTVKAYLFAIARNCYLQALRRDRRRAALDAEIADPRLAPDTTYEQRAELARVSLTLQQLPEPDRSALLMRSVDNMSYQEIAEALGLSLAAVKARIHRARLKLAADRGL